MRTVAQAEAGRPRATAEFNRALEASKNPSSTSCRTKCRGFLVGRTGRSCRINELRVLEALRVLCGAPTRKLPPPPLHDVTEVPVPLDHVPGAEFRYECDGDTANPRARPSHTARRIMGGI